ncbi:trichohyalin [Sphaeramia orbicularis]|uniref:trichohyalin n=1 Tax=Sphaeramia orbicularis TaxID=375764 RepID=UPI00117DC17E|nr:leucine-, glutamate- and lysine-rich protein 1 [Sphaeramia orbicularis]
MGDKERPLKEELEEEEEEEEEKEEEMKMKVSLSCRPIYPLPDDIKKMQRSETVCSYCGVSYLIFHEFHQLHTQLAQLEAELQDLKDTAQREKAQREALELGRIEWEKALHLEVQRKAEENERSLREKLEGKSKEMRKALRGELEQKHKNERQEMAEEYQKRSDEKVRNLRKELGEIEAERLKKQKEELELKAEEREKVLSDALQKANKNLDELRKHLQQLEERLAIASSAKEKVEQALGKEKQQGETLRGVCVQQQQALRGTLSVLRSFGCELTDVRGFLSQLTGAWQASKSQMLQHSTQVFSALTERMKHSSVEFQKMREEREHLTQQLMEQKRQSEQQLSQQDASEKEQREKLLRLKGELEEKHERLLSCQQKCDTLHEELSSWQQREEKMNWKYSAAEEEVTQLRKALERVQQETRELRRERDMWTESHGRALRKMEEDCQQQLDSKLADALEKERTKNELHLKEQMEELHRDMELELTIDREKSQLLLRQYQQDSTQLLQKLEERDQEVQRLEEDLKKERRSREQIHEELQRSKQQEALQLNQATAELQMMTEKNRQLQEEVALLHETVRRECEEREELTAALSQAQEELLGQRSPASAQKSVESMSYPPDRHTSSLNKHPGVSSQTTAALPRSQTFPITLQRSPSSTDKSRDGPTDAGAAGRSVEPWDSDEVFARDKRRRGGLKAGSKMNDAKRKVDLVTRMKEKQSHFTV